MKQVIASKAKKYASVTWTIVSILSIIFTLATIITNADTYGKKVHTFFAFDMEVKVISPVVAEKK